MKRLPAGPRGEKDITTGFEPVVGGSIPSEGTRIMSDPEIFIQILGWIGTTLVVGAYLLLVAFKKITEDSRVYQIMNFLGAIFLGINLFWQNSWPAFTLQAMWAIIAVVSLVRKTPNQQ
mgnify:CR=1 FL=1